MTCGDLRNILAEKRELTESARQHLRECAGCSALLDALQEPDNTLRNSVSLAKVQSVLASPLAPARTMPSDRTLATLLFLFFAAFALLITLPLGYSGFKALSLGEKLTDYSVILLLGLGLSAAVAKELFPGSKRSLRTSVLLLLGLLVLFCTTIVLFQDFDTERFVPRGVRCLGLGLFSAVICSAASSFLLNAGYVTAAVRTGALMGGLAGLAGFAVLALHCPLLNSAHILAWHLGAAAIATLAGTLVGYLFRNGPPLRSRAV